MGAATGVSVTAASLEAVGASAVAGVVSGQASRAAENFVTGQDLSAGLVDPRTMTVDAVAGAAGPALRAARGQVAPFVEGRITRNMSASIDDLVQDSNFLAMTARRQGSAIHEATENLMRLEGIRGLEFRPAVGNVQVRGQGGYPDYWFHPENRIWDLKTLNDPFPDTWKGRLYGELTGADVEAIRYDPWWR